MATIAQSAAGGGFVRVALVDAGGRLLSGDAALAEQVRGAAFAGVDAIERWGELFVAPGRGAGGEPGYTIVAFDRASLSDRFAAVRHAYGLSERQTALAEALLTTGGLNEAAEALGWTYVSARNTLSELKAKLGMEATPMIVGQLLDLLSAPSGGAGGRHDLFGLSERQYAIASMIGLYKSRGEIAARLHVSEAVVKAELKTIHLVLGVRSAAELVRVVAEARLSSAISALGADPLGFETHRLPAAVLDIGERAVVYSDFGPADGVPVLILHSTICGRAPPTRLVAALRAAGFRPLAIDRPGFGGTTPAPAEQDHYAVAARDAAAVCAALGIAQVDVVARGSGHAAVRLAQVAPGLVRRAVLVNPTPGIDATPVDSGPLGAIKRRFARSPRAIDQLIRVLANLATPERLRDAMVRSFRKSPPDSALVRDDPLFVADYLRATRDFAQGRVQGYVAEQAGWARGYEVEPMPGLTDWRIVQGRHFVLHDPVLAAAYWRGRLPDTPLLWVEEAGQLLAYSHPAAVVAALR